MLGSENSCEGKQAELVYIKCWRCYFLHRMVSGRFFGEMNEEIDLGKRVNVKTTGKG